MSLKAHFDGRVFVPDGPVDDIAPGTQVEVILPTTADVEDAQGSARASAFLLRVVEIGRTMPSNPDTPPDFASQVDHYLYGLPKRP
jgi:hypothetical protein